MCCVVLHCVGVGSAGVVEWEMFSVVFHCVVVGTLRELGWVVRSGVLCGVTLCCGLRGCAGGEQVGCVVRCFIVLCCVR